MADQSARKSSTPVAPPLVGREREQSALNDALTAALDGRGTLVLLGGEAGIGKTALAEALLAEATERGALVLVGRCYDLAETPPYGPWREVFAPVSADADLPTLPTALLPSDRGGEALGSQEAIAARAQTYLATLAARRPLVLLLDDMHWADPASLDLLRFLARSLTAVPLFILVAYRADELTRRHPLYALLPLLEREGRAIRLDLRPLDAPALHALVGRYALPSADAARLVNWLLARAEGNALFSTQLLRALEDEGALTATAGDGGLGDLERLVLPAALRQVLDARLARLGADNHRLLTLAAVIGHEAPLALWAEVAGIDEDGLFDAVDAAEEAHLVAVAADGASVRFAHALIREALYEGLAATRRRRVHRRAGEALLATPAPDPDAVADHLQRAGDPRAGAWLVRAGERAQRAYAWLTAAARYEAALALLGGDEAAAGERAWLLACLGGLRRYSDAPHAIACLTEAERLAAAAGDRALAAYALHTRGYVRTSLGDVCGGLAEQEAGLSVLHALPEGERARLRALRDHLGDPVDPHYGLGMLLVSLNAAGRFAEVRARGERLVADGPQPGATDPARGLVYADACVALSAAYEAFGQPDAARRTHARARDYLRVAGHFSTIGASALGELAWVVVPYLADRPAERELLLTEAREALARASGTGWLSPELVGLPLLTLESRWPASRDLAAALADGNVWWQAMVTPALAAVALARGEKGLVRELVRTGLPDGPGTPPGEAFFRRATPLQQLAAASATAAGDLPLARRWLEAHDRWLDWAGVVLGRAEGALGWAAYHRAAGDLALASLSAAAAVAHASDPRQPLALLAAHRLLGELSTEGRQFAEAQTHLDAALALAVACAAPYERALTLLALAELHAIRGVPGRAREALDVARAILEPLSARPALARAEELTAQLTGPPDLPAPAVTADSNLARLSARELEVLRLVAQGLTNAEVAGWLFLSPRTVGQHLRSIYNKLGVDNRTAAAHFAVKHGVV